MTAKKIYIDSAVLDFLKNPDALSQNFTVFKHGGKIDGRDAIPCELIET